MIVHRNCSVRFAIATGSMEQLRVLGKLGQLCCLAGFRFVGLLLDIAGDLKQGIVDIRHINPGPAGTQLINKPLTLGRLQYVQLIGVENGVALSRD